MEAKKLKELHGLKARHTPYELIGDKWQQNPEHKEEVVLLEYFRHTFCEDIIWEGILFIRPDWTLGRDRLDAFTLIN